MTGDLLNRDKDNVNVLISIHSMNIKGERNVFSMRLSLVTAVYS